MSSLHLRLFFFLPWSLIKSTLFTYGFLLAGGSSSLSSPLSSPLSSSSPSSDSSSRAVRIAAYDLACLFLFFAADAWLSLSSSSSCSGIELKPRLSSWELGVLFGCWRWRAAGGLEEDEEGADLLFDWFSPRERPFDFDLFEEGYLEGSARSPSRSLPPWLWEVYPWVL